MNRLFTSVILLILFSSTSTFAQDKIVGIWQTENNKAKVQIYENTNLIYGKIISVSEVKNNKKIGLLVLKRFKPNGNLYEEGTILEPNHNHIANGKLTLSEDGMLLKVKGSAFMGLISKTETWTRIN
jgi:uncharacterized protein (DUF2147 family)